jgi:hypothetical protein
MAKKAEKQQGEEPKRTAKPSDDSLWIVNPGGALHLVSREHAREKFREVGWRKATAAEIAELEKRQGNQRFDDPIAEPWTPEPTEEGVGDAELDA